MPFYSKTGADQKKTTTMIARVRKKHDSKDQSGDSVVAEDFVKDVDCEDDEWRRGNRERVLRRGDDDDDDEKMIDDYYDDDYYDDDDEYDRRGYNNMNDTRNGNQGSGEICGQSRESTRVLNVEGISQRITGHHLREIFGAYGQIENVSFGMKRRFARVEFKMVEDA